MKKYLFNYNIVDWHTWGKVFQSINIFNDLLKEIFKNENLVFTKIENTIPGTNAVFKIGDYIIKIMPPIESGEDLNMDFDNELYSLKEVNRLDINAPKLISYGIIEDRYIFRYAIFEYIIGEELHNIWDTLDNNSRYAFGVELRQIVDKLNTNIKNFTDKNPFSSNKSNLSFSNYNVSFKLERIKYINNYDYKDFIYVHGDLTKDNIIISHNNMYLIDFADSMMAPSFYEESLIISELCNFDYYFILGYFKEYNIEKLSDITLNGLLIHEYGGELIKSNIGDIDNINNIYDLKNLIINKFIENDLI